MGDQRSGQVDEALKRRFRIRDMISTKYHFDKVSDEQMNDPRLAIMVGDKLTGSR